MENERVEIMSYILIIILSYLVGCSSMSYYIGKLNGFNMKEKGTGNLGASNTVLLIGWKAGALVALHDILKAVLVVCVTRYFFSSLPYALVLSGTSCILGHIFPFYLNFKGGKGLASYVGVALALDYKFGLFLILAIIIVTLITDYIVCGTLTTMFITPIYFSFSISFISGLILSVASIVMIFKHIENIKRIINGTEVGLRRANKGDGRIK